MELENQTKEFAATRPATSQPISCQEAASMMPVVNIDASGPRIKASNNSTSLDAALFESPKSRRLIAKRISHMKPMTAKRRGTCKNVNVIP
mmetsp:Transcript_93111/g.221478  ORF Transcript_93111/g.221478 Transcript_93111/m.221478 type:complete len:91 (-) Transcript_93111:1236-1508(-)